MYQIFIRDANLNRVGEVTDYQSLEMLPRFNDVGSFVLNLPTDTFACRELTKPKSGIIVARDGKPIFSGTVTNKKRSWSASGDVMTLAGKDDNHALARHVAFPVPGGDFGQADYDVRTGKAETVLKQYVDVNTGPNARPDRRRVTIQTDTGLGTTVTGRARFNNLLELLQSLALSGGGLGFRVIQIGGSLEFQVYQPTDKSNEVVFSPLLGNLASYEYSSDAPIANFVLVGGQGEGKERTILHSYDSDSINRFDRIETFIDRRDTADVAELEQAMAEELASKAEKVSLNFVPIDTPDIAYGREYGLGDKVSVDIGGEIIKDLVREVSIKITPNGVDIVPNVGTDESKSSASFGIFGRMKRLSKRISQLERSL